MSDIPEGLVALGAPRPEPPREPEPHECCGSGCVPCVYDNYWEKLAYYEELLGEWQKRNPQAT